MRQPEPPASGLPTAADESFEGWQAVAGAWERRRAFVWEASRPVSDRLVDLLDPQPAGAFRDFARAESALADS